MAKRRKRVPPKTIFIACEGKNTEPIYFERIKEQIEDENIFALTIYPDRENGEHKSDPIGLINEALDKINEFDEVWVVYDKDGYTKHKEALGLAQTEINGKKVNIAFSSISFEHWVLLHFEKNAIVYNKSKDIIEQKFLSNENYFPDYSKRGDVDIYPVIKGLTDNAIENSAWLRYMQKSDIASKDVYDVNPFTDVDVLIKKLLRIDEEITFYSIGELLLFNNLSVMVTVDSGELYFEIINSSANSIVLNQVAFSVVKNDGELKQLGFNNQVLLPNTEYQVQSKEVDCSNIIVRYGTQKGVVVIG
ncbi:RloB family protein [Pseudofulvibacter geojedonensis]|uniref:RloB family protein n=1 Tax=Pseudofulvibacter geojedonensis TaxID=1123758 RepID=A0ABW3I203_9FLAO